VLAAAVRRPRKYSVYATAVGPVPSAINSPTASGPSLKLSPPNAAASGIRIRPPRVKPNPVTVSSSRPGTGLAPVRVTAAKPAAASTARPALARTALSANPDGRPTSRPRPASARQAATGASRPGRCPVTQDTPSTMTGAVPMATRVASATEVSATALK